MKLIISLLFIATLTPTVSFGNSLNCTYQGNNFSVSVKGEFTWHDGNYDGFFGNGDLEVQVFNFDKSIIKETAYFSGFEGEHFELTAFGETQNKRFKISSDNSFPKDLSLAITVYENKEIKEFIFNNLICN